MGDSLNAADYADFLAAFPGTSEALQAARHKRLIETWDGLDKSATRAIETFLAGDVFDALRNKAHAFIISEADGNPEFSALLSKLQTAEQEENRLAWEAAQRLEEERLAEQRLAEEGRAAAAREAAKLHRTSLFIAVVFLILLLAGFAISIYLEQA